MSRTGQGDSGGLGPEGSLPSVYRDLPPTALRLLEGARRLLESGGYDSLSVEAIGREAGVNKNLIGYHFGSKNGLLVALVDWLLHEMGLNQLAFAAERRGDRSAFVRDSAEQYVIDLRTARIFFDLFPRLTEDPAMAVHLRELYRTVRNVYALALWDDDEHEMPEVAQRLAAMSIALVEGLAVQQIAEPGCIDVAPTLDLWWSTVTSILDSARAADQPG